VLKPKKYEVLVFRDRSGKSPYLEWLDTLDWKTQERILNRVARTKHGQFGDFKSLDAGLYEMRLFFGSGYRIYFGEHRGKVILILTGGDKATQRKDIAKAKDYWNIYLEDHA
jgi:putative addiction module killer protein